MGIRAKKYRLESPFVLCYNYIMANKSSVEIQESAKLVNYQELAQFRVETWKDEEHTHRLFWFYSNDGIAPSFMEQIPHES